MTNGKNVVTNEHGIKKIEAYFDNIKKRGQNLFIPYIVAGDGGLDVLVDRIKLLEKSGVAAIELGIPFSDPVADGPTIQRAGMRAIRNGVTLKSVLALMEETKAERNVPIIFMTYFNPVLSTASRILPPLASAPASMASSSRMCRWKRSL